MSSRLLDAINACPVKFNHKQLDFSSVKELPASHAWIELDEHPSSVYPSIETVQVIDLNDPNALKLIGHACKSWGVFQVTNHGISKELLHEVKCATKNLFSLPMPQKLKASRSANDISGYGAVPISTFFPKQMWSEGFTIVGSPMEHARKLWPQDYNPFCDVIEEYRKEMKQLAGRLMGLILGSLGLTKEDIKWSGPKGEFTRATDALNLNSYPPCPEPDSAMGIAAHTDSSLFTIIYQSNTSGLQVLKEGNGWIMVPSLSGALVVQVGDLFHILSNGIYPSVLHRVMVNQTKHRFSVAYFYRPPSLAQVSPLPELIDSNHPPLYKQLTVREYLETKGKYFKDALSFVRL